MKGGDQLTKLDKYEELLIRTAFQKQVWEHQDWVKHALDKPGSNYFVHEVCKTIKSAWQKSICCI